MTDEVSNVGRPGLGTVVLGDDVDMSLRAREACPEFTAPAMDARRGDQFSLFFDPLWAAVAGSFPFDAVCILVLTTSNGHVIIPAKPPAVVAVKTSSLIPMLSDLAYCFAQVRSCS